MDISVIIPTRQRPAKLADCLRKLRHQAIGPADGLTYRFEVLVGIDGEDDTASRDAALRAWGDGPKDGLRVVVCPRAGLASTRNRLLPTARGKWILSINDDVLAEPGFLHVHAVEQLARERSGQPAIIVGDSPWKTFRDDTLFDRLVRQTSLIFFYDRMYADPNPDRNWGFRHCFGLNFSAPASALREIGGFRVFPATYGYEDVEAAWRLRERFGMPVLFRPRARAVHDHRYTAGGYLAREESLGYAAWGFAQTAPQCAKELFGRDILSPAETAYSREYVEREANAAARARESFLGLERIPADAIDGGHSAELMNLIYEQHLVLKRWEWRRGLIRAAEEAEGSTRAVAA